MMWKCVKLAGLFIVATLCHWGIATLFSYAGLNVNVMLIFAVAFCAVLNLEWGYPLAFLCGLFLDFFGTKLFGNNAFLFTMSACVIYFLKERIDFGNPFTQMLTIFLLTCTVSLLNTVLLIWFASSLLWPGVWSWLGSAVVGALLSPVVFWLVSRAWNTVDNKATI